MSTRPNRAVPAVLVLPHAGRSGDRRWRPAAALAAPGSTDRPELKQGLDNKPERLEWFRDLGFGMFIHWSVDSQLGSDISHSLAGASDDYRKRFFEELPSTFNPRKFHPEDWARAGPAGGHEIRRVHHQAPLGLRHVEHQDHALQRDAHARQARPDRARS